LAAEAANSAIGLRGMRALPQNRLRPHRDRGVAVTAMRDRISECLTSARRVRCAAWLTSTSSTSVAESREWTDEDGTRWQEMNGLSLYQRPGERNWTMRPPTSEERQHNTEQLAAYRAEGWAGTVAAYAAHPADLLAAWRYLTAHPVFWSYLVPSDLADIDPREVDEATWARIGVEGLLSDSDGLAHLDVNLGRSEERLEVRLEHGPVLWPLDVPAQYRTSLRVGGTPSYDPSLDVTEPTWEEAIVTLSAKVRQRYGDDRARVPAPWSSRDDTAG
jgi:hypothetical protein